MRFCLKIIMPKNNTKSKGIVFWITGYSGSGKTEIAKSIKPFIVKIWKNATYFWNNLRNIFNLSKFIKIVLNMPFHTLIQ